MKKRKGINKQFLDELISLRDQCRSVNSSKLQSRYNLLKKQYIDQLSYLIDKRTWKYKGFSNYEDLRQEGRVGLVMALNSYCPGKGDFFWWVDKYVKTRVTREANRHSTIKIPLKHTRKNIPYKVSKIPVMVDGSPMACDSIQLAQISEKVRDAVDKLPEEERRVIRSYFEFENKYHKRSNSVAGVCKDLKMSRVKCIDLLDRAKSILKKELSNIKE